MKTILLITHSSAAVGGGEDDFLRLLKFLQGKFKIYSIFPEGERAAEFAKLSDKYLVVPNRPYPGNIFRLKPILAYLYFNLIKLFILFPFLRKNRKNIDLCFVNSSVCILEIRLLKFFKMPYVISIKEKINPGYVMNYVHKLIDKSASKVIVISHYLKKLLSENVKNKDITVIRASIDEDDYLSIKKDQNQDVKRTKFVILNVGQIYGLKNQLLLVEAVNKLKFKDSISLKFVGFVADDKYDKELKKKVHDYGMNNMVEFLGALNKQEIVTEYLNSDLVVITSKEEGMSLVLVEALFFEKPVISTNVGVVPEVIINGENGIIIDALNPDSLTVALENLISNKILYNKIKENAYNTYKSNFNLRKTLEEHLEIFEECINNN